MTPISVTADSIGTWIGVGIGLLGICVTIWLALRWNEARRNQRQRGGARSTNLQAGRDIRISGAPATPPDTSDRDATQGDSS
jgi:hypothetical protein